MFDAMIKLTEEMNYMKALPKYIDQIVQKALNSGIESSSLVEFSELANTLLIHAEELRVMIEQVKEQHERQE